MFPEPRPQDIILIFAVGYILYLAYPTLRKRHQEHLDHLERRRAELEKSRLEHQEKMQEQERITKQVFEFLTEVAEGFGNTEVRAKKWSPTDEISIGLIGSLTTNLVGVDINLFAAAPDCQIIALYGGVVIAHYAATPTNVELILQDVKQRLIEDERVIKLRKFTAY